MQDQRDEIRRAMKPVVAALDDLGVRYAVVGSVAGLSHGWGRVTIDVDVVAEFESKHVEEFAARFDAEEFYVDAAMIRDAVRRKSSFNLLHFETGIKVDVFVSKTRPYDLEVMARREMETMSDGTSPAFQVESAEDLALSKIVWFKSGGEVSDRQWNDVLGVLKTNAFDLDFEYLEKWADELNISHLLEKALDESGLKT